MSEKYLIWSNYHSAWWGPEERGYTSFFEEAGRYERQDAITISASARGGWNYKITEIPISESDAVELFKKAPKRIEHG